MYKVGVCGHFAFGEQFNSGQKDKTISVYNALVNKLGKNAVTTVDTRGWKKNPLKLIFECNKLLKESENIIMLPATNGLKVFPRLFEFLNIFYKMKNNCLNRAKEFSSENAIKIIIDRLE